MLVQGTVYGDHQAIIVKNKSKKSFNCHNCSESVAQSCICSMENNRQSRTACGYCSILKAFSQIHERDVKCLLSCKQAAGDTLYLHHFSQGGHQLTVYLLYVLA